MALPSPLILLVDDDPDFLRINRQILEALRYRVVCCRDPQEALTTLEVQRPDLIISDLMMTALDSGFSFARRVKGDPRFSGIPVILVTAVASQRGYDLTPRTPDELATMGADAYFTKPVAPDTLQAKVEELLARSMRTPAT